MLLGGGNMHGGNGVEIAMADGGQLPPELLEGNLPNGMRIEGEIMIENGRLPEGVQPGEARGSQPIRVRIGQGEMPQMLEMLGLHGANAGGGGGVAGGSGTCGAGGQGGGTAGSRSPGSQDATANRGGGSGGTRGDQTAGAGGKGIVIVEY